MVTKSRIYLWSAIYMVLAGAAGVQGADLTFRGEAAWGTWETPFGLIEVGDRGQLQLIKFRKDIDVVKNAHLFSYESKSRGMVHGGIWEARSNPGTAEFIIDGNPTTYWQPDPNDSLEDWAIEIDLGRPVLAREIRLTFPDEEGAGPFRQFTVYLTTGTRISVKEDLFQYDPAYRTTRPNHETSIVIPLEYTVKDSTMVVDVDLEIDRMRESRYRLFQRIRILFEERTEDAGLAEVEVLGVGDNVSIGTLQRGGFVNGGNATESQNLFDADI